MSKVFRVQNGDFKILIGDENNPGDIVFDTGFGGSASTGTVLINGDLEVTGNVPGPDVSNVMYVTENGNDANTGFGEGPGQAKRTLKSAAEDAPQGTTIFVRSGEYYEDNPIRLPPNVSVIGDNLRRTIIYPLNGPKTFTVNNVERTNNIVTVVTNEIHELQLNDRVRVIIPEGSIDYECANITKIVDANTFQYIERNFTDLGPTASTVGTVEQGTDLFFVNNQSYVAQLVIKGLRAPGYCINVDKDAIIDTSPYVQNCSNINGPWLRNGTEWKPFITEQPNLAGVMVKGPRPLRDDEIEVAQVDTFGVNVRGGGGGMLIDGDRYNPISPIKSMVGDAFTQIAQGGVGFHITNFGYMQLVSCFSVFCDKAFYTTNGGYLSISNSVVDFGNNGFIADGYYPTPYSSGVVNADYFSRVGSITVNDEGSGYSSLPNATIDAPAPSPSAVQATVIVNYDDLRGTINAITPLEPGDGYITEPNITIDPPFLPTQLWAPDTVYGLGEYVLAGVYQYEVTTAGTSDSLTAPEHLGGSAINGTVEFTYVGTQATAAVNLATNISIDVNNVSEKPQVGSILFIENDPIGYYIKSATDVSSTFKYNESKCRRDVELITDAVISDAIFGTNFRTVYAARAYLRSYTSKVLSSQKAETLDAIDQLRNILVTGPLSAYSVVINTLFGIVNDIINNEDPDFVLPLLTQQAGGTPGLLEASNILQANKLFLEDQLVDFINNTPVRFTFDETKCRRDVGIIINAVIDDLVFGTNYKTKTAGISYLRSYTSEVTENQKAETISGINRARDVILEDLDDEGDSEVKIRKLFNNVTNIIQEQDTSTLPVTTYTNANASRPAQYIADARAIESAKQTLINDAITFINDNLLPSTIERYNETTCRRDVGYIVDAIVFDIMYGGNSATIDVANSFFDGSDNSIVSTQVFEHASTFTFLKGQLDIIAPDTTVSAAGLVAHGELIDYLIDAIQAGTSAGIPATTDPVYTQGSFYTYYLDERARILPQIPLIEDEVIDYLTGAFGTSFTYNETTCRRDVGYIIDALSYDLTYGGNTQTTNAALSYIEGSVIAGEIEETVAAYKYWKEILLQVITNQPVPDAVPGQNTTVPVGTPAAAEYPASITQNLLQIVIDSIEFGPGYVPEPITEPEYLLGDNTLEGIRETVLDDILSYQDSVIDYINTTYGGNTSVTLYPGVLSAPAGSTVKFHNVSTISTGGTALEYVGAGVTYNALPFFGGEPIPEKERQELNSGRCFTVTNDQVGNFRVGGLFTVDALTGGVDINANEINLSGLGSIGPFLRGGIPVGVELQEVSNNPDLISSLGTQDINTVPTQFAVATYIENNYLNKSPGAPLQVVNSEVSFLTDVTIEGDLTVNGATTTINSTVLQVDDINIELATTDTPTDITSNGGGIILKGDTDKTILWDLATTAWTLSENLNINGSNLTTTSASFNLLNDTPTTVNAFGNADNINIGATTGTLTINNNQVVFNSTDSIQIPVGTTAQRDITPSIGQIRFNSDQSTFEGFGAGAAWGSLGGVRDVDQDTYIIPELAAGTDEDTLFFYTATQESATLDSTTFNVNVLQTVFNSTDSIQIPVGTTAQRDITPSIGQIRFNSDQSTFEGFGAGAAWGSLGGVRDVDQDTYIIPELAAGTDEDTLFFYTATQESATLDSTTFNVNVLQTIFNSVDSIQIPVGTTAQRDITPSIGQIRFNSDQSTFEGFGAGAAWGSLGGVRDVDQDTYIIPELAAGTDEDTLFFYTATQESATLDSTTFNVNVLQTRFTSTDSIKLPVGTTAQRDITPEVGQVRYNTDLVAFEGFGPGAAWGTLGGVIDVDRDTSILAELSPGSNENTLFFDAGGVRTLELSATDFILQSPVVMTVNNTTDTTVGNSATGALVVAGGIGVGAKITGAGYTTDVNGNVDTITSEMTDFVIDEGTFPDNT